MFETRTSFTRPDERSHSSTEAIDSALAQSRTQTLPGWSQPIKLAPLVRALQPLMRVGIYELSNTPGRCGETIDFVLPKEGKATVRVGAVGMPTAHDFDFIILLTSQLAHQLTLNKGNPPKTLVIRITDILKYCQRNDTSQEFAELEKSLTRLKNTKIEAEYDLNKKLYRWGPEGLIEDFVMLPHNTTGKPSAVQIQVPNWMFDWIVISKGKQALPLTHRYFQISDGLGRYLYLLASTADGEKCAYWPRQKLYANSHSQLPLDRFWDSVCEQASNAAFPDFEMTVIPGNNEPILVMRRRLGHLVNSGHCPVM